MATSTSATVHIGENSPEHVAYRLMHDVAMVERRAFHRDELASGWAAADREWIFKTYRECLYAVTNTLIPKP
jgi:hypothetical protein